MNRIWMATIAMIALASIGCGNPSADEPAKSTTETSKDAGKTDGAAANQSKAEPKEPGVGDLKAAEKNLVKTDIKVGKGPAAAEGDLAVMEYKGTFKDGTVFDTNTTPDREPFVFRIGLGMVIKGWDLGIVGMKVGGERRLSIPYLLAYGEQGRPPKIPAKSDLNFDVKLLALVKKGAEGEIEINDVKKGSGPEARPGKRITVHYVGTLVNGKKFDSSRDRNEPFTFTLGAGEVIKGWDAGVRGMRVGGVRKLRIPPDMAYGAQGQGAIGPDQVLDFEVELLKVAG